MNITTVQIRNLTRVLPTYVVFGSAAYQSFWHSVHVAAAHGAADPWLLPISIDGVMIVAARYVSHGRTRAARVLACVVMVVAMGATLGINALAAPHGDLVGLGVATWPALGMILTAALIHWAPQKPVPARRTRRPANVKPITSARAKKSA